MLPHPLRRPALIALAECLSHWPYRHLSAAKLAEPLLSQPSVSGWKMIFEANLAYAMQDFSETHSFQGIQ